MLHFLKSKTSKKVFVFLFIISLAPTLILAAQNKEKGIKIGMVTDVGGINDQSFNQSAWEGLKRAKTELSIKVSYQESKQDADYASNLETLTDAKNDLIWGIGFKMGDKILAAAKQNPKQKYAIIDVAFEKTPANLIGVLFKSEEPCFLVGYIAGKMSKTGTIGFVGGIKVPLIQVFQYAYMAGAKYANPKIKIIDQYAESFTDAAKGKAMANQMFKQGADIIFAAAGSVGDGVIEAAKEQNRMAIGVDRDQNSLAPDNVITSAMKRVDNAIFNIAKDLQKGIFKGGTTITYSLKDGGVDIAPTTSKHVPASILKEVDKLKTNIISGKLIAPTKESEYNKFLKVHKL
ncbi:MAG: BMP family ABC transporter substrate-binding protein [Oligoflexia bacterium]|nr:BMP family ABC transporter substrate-binding protein [Oligoflexia bacterium]